MVTLDYVSSFQLNVLVYQLLQMALTGVPCLNTDFHSDSNVNDCRHWTFQNRLNAFIARYISCFSVKPSSDRGMACRQTFPVTPWISIVYFCHLRCVTPIWSGEALILSGFSRCSSLQISFWRIVRKMSCQYLNTVNANSQNRNSKHCNDLVVSQLALQYYMVSFDNGTRLWRSFTSQYVDSSTSLSQTTRAGTVKRDFLIWNEYFVLLYNFCRPTTGERTSVVGIFRVRMFQCFW